MDFFQNFLSLSLMADIIFHPLEFTAVLVQIGYNPEEMSVGRVLCGMYLLYYTLIVFYFPNVVQATVYGPHLMGDSNFGVTYYLQHIYKRDGIVGCYRGLVPKVCARATQFQVSELYNQMKLGERTSGEDEVPLKALLLSATCCNLLTTVCSHPFHVIMVKNFAEFTTAKRWSSSSNILQLANAIYSQHGLQGFFIGLVPRAVGELLYVLFCVTYSKLTRNLSRSSRSQTVLSRSFVQLQHPEHLQTFLQNMSLTFGLMMVRDIVAKRLAYPFYLVCNSTIILGTGWERLPFLPYLAPLHRI